MDWRTFIYIKKKKEKTRYTLWAESQITVQQMWQTLRQLTIPDFTINNHIFAPSIHPSQDVWFSYTTSSRHRIMVYSLCCFIRNVNNIFFFPRVHALQPFVCVAQFCRLKICAEDFIDFDHCDKRQETEWIWFMSVSLIYININSWSLNFV